MPSPAERARVAGEWLLRAASVAVLAILLWRALHPAVPVRTERIEVPAPEHRALDDALARWTSDPPRRAHLELTAPPSPSRRAWLRALRAAGTEITWSGDSLPALAIATEPLAEPRRRTRIAAAAPSGSRLLIGDAVGTLDSLEVAGAGGAVAAEPLGAPTARLAHTVAVAERPDSLVLRPILLLARAAWEAKFAMAALEEEGWTVHARLSLGPGMEVRQGPAGTIDIATYAAVLLLDSASAPGAERLGRYVRSGGGLVVVAGAARAPGIAGLAPAAIGPRVRPPAAALAAAVSPATLPLRPLVRLGDDAVALERRDGAVAVAARRLGAGRVVQAGYEESWRWRMAGGEAAIEEHRRWWSRLVSAAAYAPTAPREPHVASPPLSSGDAMTPDPAPLASLIASLGTPSPRSEADLSSARARVEDGWLFLLLLTFLLAEWASRRLRGAR